MTEHQPFAAWYWGESDGLRLPTVLLMDDLELARALRDMGAVDADRARWARAVVERLAGGGAIDEVSLADLLRFAWYSLPLKWSETLADQLELLDAAGELFQRLGLERFAEVCRSPETKTILEAYADSQDEGFKAFQSAYARSGVDPPDLDDFAWGDVMGKEEVAALSAAEWALQEAIIDGRLNPGASGWKAVARSITAGVLDASHPELVVQRRRDAILTDRLQDWLRRAESHSPDLHALRSRNVKRLLHPVPLPPDAHQRMEPIAWLLGQAGSGTRLTQAGYLPTALVREGWERFDWSLGWTDRPPRSESEVVQLHELHQLLRRLGAIRRRRSDLTLGTLGRQMMDDSEFTWRTVAAGLSDGEWPKAVAEVFTLLLLDGVSADRDLENRAAGILGEMGWSSDGEPPHPMVVMSTWYVTRRPLTALGGIESAGDWSNRRTVLTGFGEATLVEQIRAEATGPSSRAW